MHNSARFKNRCFRATANWDRNGTLECPTPARDNGCNGTRPGMQTSRKPRLDRSHKVAPVYKRVEKPNETLAKRC
jgi:hypothetical protein